MGESSLHDPRTAPSAPRVAVTGASGLLGSAVVPRLEAAGYRVVRLVRSHEAAEAPDAAYWNPDRIEVDADALEGLHAVVHLAGENVGQRWTEGARRRIRESRVTGTRLLAEALPHLERRPEVLVCASATGFYGDRGDAPVDEGAAPGAGFLAEVVRDWEAATAPAVAAGIRVVTPRFGVVLSAAGGALGRMLPFFRMGLGGPVGGGRQWLSWISRRDAAEVVLAAIRDPELSGPVNAVAGAARNADFGRALGRALGRPAVLPVPGFVLKALYGRMAEETLLSGARVEPTRLRERGHAFLHPDLDTALRAALADEE